MPTAPSPTIIDRPDIDESTENDLPWNVFLWNDDITPMQVVVGIIQAVFSYTKEKAEQYMLEAHTNGKTVIWSGKREEAHAKVELLHAYGVNATMGKDA